MNGVGELVLTVIAGKGVTRVQVRGTSPGEEKASLRLYNRIKPIIEALDVHAVDRKLRTKPS